MKLTTYEASQKYGISTSHLRRLLAQGIIKGRSAATTPKRTVWIIEEKSLKTYLKKERKPGPKPHK